MRFIRPGTTLVALALLAAGGCVWTEFDDLKDEAWTTATGKPKSEEETIWGAAIARVRRDGSGGTLAVLGAASPTYSEVVVDPDGGFEISTLSSIGADFQFGQLASAPLFLSNPDADEIALVTGLDAGRGLVIRGSGSQLTEIRVDGLSMPGAATYMVSPEQVGVDPARTQILTAQNDTVRGAYFVMAPPPPPRSCVLRDEAGGMIDIRALGAYPAGPDHDDFLALTTMGKLLLYDGNFFHGCTTPEQPKASLNATVSGVGFGSQILPIAGTPFVVVFARFENSGHLGLYQINGSSITEIGTSRNIGGLRTAALFEPASGRRFVLAGQPDAVVEGLAAGQVEVFEVDTTTGIAASPAATLFDAQPLVGQQFGRAVAQLPYNGQKIIAVAAENDLFLYYRTTLYADTRQGR